ncbi:MAG: UDP-3-O-(3-hydroxymyristoyl)glucosamine N-acyltransferase [Robiginitomaculum sp.]|nr:UDP-3-O-(3-hydroxymyristoyl)glucosamine N-acyltransferase [Robiginitomaculum sp.]
MVDTRFYKRLGPILLIDLISTLDVEIFSGKVSELLITNAAPAHLSKVGEISYYEKSRYRSNLSTCQASACFVKAEQAVAIEKLGSIPIISKFPRADFSRAATRLYQSIPYGDRDDHEIEGVDIGQNSVIGQGAIIGKGTIIGANSVIGPGVVLGENCVIGANVVIEYAILGDHCKIHHGAVIGCTGFGVAVSADGGVDIPHYGRVVIGDHVSVGSQTTIDRAMFGETKIGDGCKFDNQVQIGHNNTIGPNCMFAAHVGISGSCVIGARVIMGGKAGVADHINIGDGASLAASAGTMHDIPAGEMWSGSPALPIRQHMRQVSAIRKLVRQKKPPIKRDDNG